METNANNHFGQNHRCFSCNYFFTQCFDWLYIRFDSHRIVLSTIFSFIDLVCINQ